MFKRRYALITKEDGGNLKFCLVDFVYLIQELRSDCVYLSNKSTKILMPLLGF